MAISMKLLVENVADVNAKNLSEWTTLHYALYQKKIQILNWGEHEIFELLISFGANVNSLTLERDFLLHFCVADDEKLVSAKIEIAISNKKLSSIKSMM